ncbi:MAG: PBSX family phage terminase large subunit [Micromonosporaceae bacterium]
MQLSPLTGKALESVRLATHRLNIWDGSVRSSKTISSLVAWLKFVRESPPGNLLMVGKTERTLKRNVIDPLIEMLGPRRCRYNAGVGELQLLGRKIYVAGAHDEAAKDKIKGLTLLGAYCDELTTMPESFWSMLLTRLSEPGARLLATTNPEGPTHWLKRDYLNRAALHLTLDGRTAHAEAATLDLARFSFKLADNPNLSADYLASLEAEFVGLWRKRYILGEWAIAEGAIYDMFDDGHIVDLLPPIDRWISAGVDYGTTNPFSAVMLGVGGDADNRRLYVVSEYRYDSRAARRQLTDSEYSERMTTWLAGIQRPHEQGRTAGVTPERIYVDPSAASFMTQLWRDRVANVAHADNDVLDGIRTTSTLFAQDRLKIHSSCRALLDELPGYAWDPKATAKGEDKPLKVDDHGPDAVRYAAHSSAWVWRPMIQPLRVAA